MLRRPIMKQPISYLGKFTKVETPEIELAIERSVDAVQDWIRDGAERVMAKIN